MVILLSVGLTGAVQAQLHKKIKRAAERGAERAVERRVYNESMKKADEAMDVIFEEKDNKKSKTKNQDSALGNTGSLEENQQTSVLMEDGPNQVRFQRGSRILYSDDFSSDAIGDFPAKWNTSEGGEVKKLSGFSEKWLRVPAKSVINLEMKNPLPPNFTLEFDLIIPANIPIRMVGFAFGKKPEKLNYTLLRSDSYGFMFYSQDNRDYDALKYGIYKRNSEAQWSKANYKVPLNLKIHVALEINNHKRIRSYIDGIKITDAPRDFNPDLAKAFFFHGMTHGAKESELNYFYISNVVIAESGTDQRSLVMKELIEKGSFTTNDILFASGSDKIESSSAAILNEIGDAMKTAPNAQFRIIGHTDSDGSDDANEKLSLNRANSVKNYLTQNFGIPSNNLICSGKGETEPVANNSTAEGKAKNRRVEFKKL